MERLLLKIGACSVALYFAAAVFPSIRLSYPWAPLLAGVVLAILHISLRPLLILILSPFILVTAGILTLVINAWMLMLANTIIWHMFYIPGFWLTVAVAGIVAIFDIGSRKVFGNSSLRA